MANIKSLLTLCMGMVLITGSAMAQEAPAPQATPIVVGPELVQKAKEFNNVGEVLTRLDHCNADLKTCGLTIEEANELATSCTGCDSLDAWIKNDKKPCTASTATPATGGGKKSTARKPLKPTDKVKFVSLCLDDATLDVALGKAPKGYDGITVARKDAFGNECVPTFEASKRSIDKMNAMFKAVCRADGVKMTEHEKQVLRGLNIDPDTRVDPTDPRCEATGLHIVYLLAYVAQLEKDKSATPAEKAVAMEENDPAEEAEKAREELRKLAERVAIEVDHALDERGSYVQLMGEAVRTWRWQERYQDTTGFMFRPNFIWKTGARDGFMGSLGVGVGIQPYSTSCLWRLSAEWIHFFNSTSESTGYALHMGAFGEGGILAVNVQDESQVGPIAGFQLLFGKVVFDIGLKMGIGRVGLYEYEGEERVGYSKVKASAGGFIAFGFDPTRGFGNERIRLFSKPAEQPQPAQ